MWDLEQGLQLNKSSVASHKAVINCLSFHRTGNILASGSQDYTIKLWNTEFPNYIKEIAVLSGHMYFV